ncbi:MAG TPA: hypothetical protein ENG82_04380 [Bacteroidetes bacterium]|nr:hypothetical protein [Bacteroidota bacterium]
MVAVRVEKVTLDTSTNRFVVILRDDIHQRWLPIVVGSAEAQAIALQLENISPPRPLTHDLMKNILEIIGMRVSRIVVNDLRENTYYAVISMRGDGMDREVDARPSDAIALALRMQAPIFVDEEVMQKAGIVESSIVNEPQPVTSRLEELNLELQRAVHDERFEDAARIRDEIKELTKNEGQES